MTRQSRRSAFSVKARHAPPLDPAPFPSMYFTMATTYSITRAQAQFPSLIKQSQDEVICITRHDETVAYVLSKERMEALMETLEIMANPEAMKAIQDYREGKTVFYDLSVLDE
jgi:antitoxin YefM